MKFRTRSLLKSKKAQFFVLSAFAIVTVMFFVSQWIEPFNLPETASIVLIEQPFIFNNIKEKAISTVSLAKNCEDLNYTLDEFKNYVSDYTFSKNMKLDFNYSYPSCSDSPSDPPTVIDVKMKLKSTSIDLRSNFTMSWRHS